jgi:arylsulfatase A-like enzyme
MFYRISSMSVGLVVATHLLTHVICTNAADTAQRPNIVLILADDLGYMDIRANNPQSFYETPHIDSLASTGIRFTNGYAACPVCSPTRASLMTGKYPQRTGITDYIAGKRAGKLLPAPNKEELALSEVTIAERLRDAGYAIFFAGKWHLGTGDYSPNAQGFGPGLVGAGQFYYPSTEQPPPDLENDPKTTDRIADEAVKFIEKHRDKSFFAYLPFLAVHTPIKARKSLVEKYEAKKASAPPETWGREREREVRLVQNHPQYAAMLEQMDAAVGRVLDALDRTGTAGRTMVIFTSDNGGLSTSEGHPTSNVPLRAGKGWMYEGGVRTPWFIRAPGVSRPGRVCDTPIVTMDVYPTILEFTGLPLNPDQHRDGVSLVPLLKGGRLEPRLLYWHYPHYGNQGGAPGGSVRDGDGKLIEWYEDGSRELFNLRDDLSESTNVAAKYPEKVKELAARLSAWRKDVSAVMPTPNPEYKGK